MIATFYSFKGGVGRSMALANVAERLFADGLSVLIVDFDLEAPGLERYFVDRLPPGSLDGVLNHRGVMDLLLSYRELRSLSTASAPAADGPLENRLALLPVEPLSEFIVDICPRIETDGPGLALMTAGRRVESVFKDYARQVINFNWDRFYTEEDGELFFDWFRHEAERIADVVLLDSRTGITEMSGVCTYHLADVVVSFVAANQQNQEGTIRLARSLANDELIKAGRSGRRLGQIFVPSRVEIGEGDRVKEFESTFRQRLDEAFPAGNAAVSPLSFDLALPYVPYFAFDEKVAVREAGHPLAKLLTEPIGRLTAAIARHGDARGRLYRTYHSTAEENGRLAEEYYELSDKAARQDIRRLASRLVYAYPNSPPSLGTAYLMDLGPGGLQAVEDLRRLRLVKIERDPSSRKFAQFVDDTLLKSWPRIQEWIAADATFLYWRQSLATKLATWEQSRNADDLLAGTALSEASGWVTVRAGDLSDRERAFIAISVQRSAPIQATDLSAAYELITFRRVPNDAAVVLIHGHGGDAQRTWGRFPEFLTADSHLRRWDILSIGLASGISLDSVSGVGTDTALESTIGGLRRALDDPILTGYSSLTIAAHSIGGVALQKVILDSHALGGRLSHLLLFAVPSAGLRKSSSWFAPRQGDLGERSPLITSMRKRWTEEFGNDPPFHCTVIAGDRDEFVPPSSSLEPFAIAQQRVVPGSHTSIVKPSAAADPVVRLVIAALTAVSAPIDLLNVANLAVQTREYEAAIKVLAPSVNHLDSNGVGLYAFAIAEAGRPDEAVALLTDHAATHLASADALIVLASRYRRRWLLERRRSDADRALHLYDDALRLSLAAQTTGTIAYAAINVAFMTLAYGGDIESARQAAALALEHSKSAPSDVSIRASRADALLILGETQQALIEYQRVAAMTSNQPFTDAISLQARQLADLLGDEEAAKVLPMIFRGPDAPAVA